LFFDRRAAAFVDEVEMKRMWGQVVCRHLKRCMPALVVPPLLR
jgi:hypothetical protein